MSTLILTINEIHKSECIIIVGIFTFKTSDLSCIKRDLGRLWADNCLSCICLTVLSSFLLILLLFMLLRYLVPWSSDTTTEYLYDFLQELSYFKRSLFTPKCSHSIWSELDISIKIYVTSIDNGASKSDDMLPFPLFRHLENRPSLGKTRSRCLPSLITCPKRKRNIDFIIKLH